MKKYIYGGIVLIVVGLIVALNITAHSLRKAKAEAQRQEQNNNVLQTDLQTYRAKNGDLVAKTEALVLTQKELKRYNADLVGKLKNQDIRIKDLQTAISTTTSTQLIVTVPVHDTMIKPNTVARAFEYKDKWNKISGIVDDDSARITQQSRDSLNIFHYKEPYRFLFFKWGIKAEWYSITNSNPATKIEGFKVIEMKKKGGR